MDLVEAASASALPTDGALESSPPQSAPGAPPPRSSVATQATPRPTASDAACEARPASGSDAACEPRAAHSATVSLDVRVGAALGAALGAPPADAEQRLSALSRELRSVESAHARLIAEQQELLGGVKVAMSCLPPPPHRSKTPDSDGTDGSSGAASPTAGGGERR